MAEDDMMVNVTAVCAKLHVALGGQALGLMTQQVRSSVRSRRQVLLVCPTAT